MTSKEEEQEKIICHACKERRFVRYNEFAMSGHVLAHCGVHKAFYCAVCSHGPLKIESSNYFFVLHHVITVHSGQEAPFTQVRCKQIVVDEPSGYSTARTVTAEERYDDVKRQCFKPLIMLASSVGGSGPYEIPYDCPPEEITFEKIIRLFFGDIVKLVKDTNWTKDTSGVLNIYDKFATPNLMQKFLQELLVQWGESGIPPPALIVIWCHSGAFRCWSPGRYAQANHLANGFLLGCPLFEKEIGGIHCVIRRSESHHDRFISFPFNVMVFLGRGIDYRHQSLLPDGKTLDDASKEDLDQLRCRSDWTMNVCKTNSDFPHGHSWKFVDCETFASIKLDAYRTLVFGDK